MEIRKYFEWKDNENTCHKLRDIAKAVLSEKCVTPILEKKKVLKSSISASTLRKKSKLNPK